jgi:hypothetical protein
LGREEEEEEERFPVLFLAGSLAILSGFHQWYCTWRQATAALFHVLVRIIIPSY